MSWGKEASSVNGAGKTTVKGKRMKLGRDTTHERKPEADKDLNGRPETVKLRKKTPSGTGGAAGGAGGDGGRPRGASSGARGSRMCEALTAHKRRDKRLHLKQWLMQLHRRFFITKEKGVRKPSPREQARCQ